MKTNLLLASIAAAVLSSCANYVPPGSTNMPLYQRRSSGGSSGGGERYDDRDRDYDRGPARDERPTRSDYQPELAEAYRLGYDCGRSDAAARLSRNSDRAYSRFGRGWQAYFQEGYADGYDGRGLRH